MKLTQEDIKKYGTEDEKKFLKENWWQHPDDDFMENRTPHEARLALKSEPVQKELSKWCNNIDQETTFRRGFLIGFMLGGE